MTMKYKFVIIVCCTNISANRGLKWIFNSNT